MMSCLRIWCFVALLELSRWNRAFAQAQSSGQTTTVTGPSTSNITVCRNTANGLDHDSDTAGRYAKYRAKYTNCTYLDGSLEIVFLDKNPNYDLSFLKDLREITGYVLIVTVYTNYIPLENLRIVRGKPSFFHHNQYYSIYIALNYDKNMPGVGLQELGFVSLREVISGNVFLVDNAELCYEDTIEWSDILPQDSKVVYNSSSPKRRRCEPCHESCRFNDNKLHCWGPGPEKCQNMTKIGCSPQCDGRCFGPEFRHCCDSACAVGCTGPKKSDCLACKHFENDGMCELECPGPTIYSQEHYKHVSNPDFKYSYGSLCVKSCPSHMIAGERSCLMECEPGYQNDNGKCKKCVGPCPKTCEGSPSEGVNAANIESFRGCTVILGNIRILSASFAGDSFKNISEMMVDQLSAFESVQEVTGFVQVQAKHPNFTSLGFLRNLRVVDGRKFISGTSMSFQIFDTSIQSLDLVSLVNISSGNIVVANNSKLCFADSVNWQKLAGSRVVKFIVIHNRNDTECAYQLVLDESQGPSAVQNLAFDSQFPKFYIPWSLLNRMKPAANANQVCASECSSNGCWGPRDDQCFLECANFRVEQRCIPSCSSVPLVYHANGTECKKCHLECKSNCTDDWSNSCDACLHVKDGPYCVPACPETKYPDHNNVCMPCHTNCRGGCTGSRNTVGPGACNSCAIGKYLAEKNYTVTECLAENLECEVGFYKRPRLDHNYGPMAQKQGCIKCHKECLECVDAGDSQWCSKCLHVREDGRCVEDCSSDHYLNVNGSGSDVECIMCHPRCLKCTGPTSFDCLTCKEYLIYLNSENPEEGFECVETCPDYAPRKVMEDNEMEDTVWVCVSDEEGQQRKIAIIVGCVLGGLAIITFFIVIIVVLARKRASTRKSNIRLNDKIKYGNQQLEPVSPSGVKPDLSKIRIIKEPELRRGGILGSGAFGTVYKGLWVPESENCKIIVAIKVLLEGTSANQNEELISEARIMASVENDYCIRILAFCMASQMMIVTQLMPLGCLLDFVRNNKKKIGSKLLLNWCTQIAEGMAYLEKISIVHRDLAARNVLVQEPGHVRITDFGLSKLLDHNENVVTYTGGKMPIKWLALESIQHKLFTHKSDVWSYGVTLWELFTYGQRPYETVDARNVPDLLEKGERLPQPSMCTIDVYMMLIKCWVLDAACRPSFKYLAQEFEKMSRDSSRFLIIENDGNLMLPSYTYDEKAVFRSLSVNDPEGPEKIVSPDDYIKPVSSAQSTNDQSPSDMVTNGGAGIRRAKKTKDKGNPPSSPWQDQPDGEKRKNSRYCSDPCKGAALQGVTSYPGNRFQSPSQFNYPSSVTSFAKDDYLLPKQNEPPVKYLDLANDNESDNQSDAADETSDVLPHPTVQSISSCISNPEYFDLPTYSVDTKPAATGLQRNPVQREKSQSKQYCNLEDERTQPLLGNQTQRL